MSIIRHGVDHAWTILAWHRPWLRAMDLLDALNGWFLFLVSLSSSFVYVFFDLFLYCKGIYLVPGLVVDFKWGIIGWWEGHGSVVSVDLVAHVDSSGIKLLIWEAFGRSDVNVIIFFWYWVFSVWVQIMCFGQRSFTVQQHVHSVILGGDSSRLARRSAARADHTLI